MTHLIEINEARCSTPLKEMLAERFDAFTLLASFGVGLSTRQLRAARKELKAPEQVVGTMGGTSYSYDQDGRRLLLNDNDAGKPQGIHLMIGRRPVAAFGNTAGDQQML